MFQAIGVVEQDIASVCMKGRFAFDVFQAVETNVAPQGNIHWAKMRNALPCFIVLTASKARPNVRDHVAKGADFPGVWKIQAPKKRVAVSCSQHVASPMSGVSASS